MGLKPAAVVDDQVIDFVEVFLSVFSQVNFKANDSLSGKVVGVAAQFTAVVLLFQQRKEGILALVAQHMTDVVPDVMLFMRSGAVDDPEELSNGFVFDRVKLDQFPKVSLLEMQLIFDGWQLLVLDF